VSRENIISEMPTSGGGLILDFSTRDGETIFYAYDPGEAAAYYGGIDPSQLIGERIDGATASMGPAALEALGAAAELL
jgi:hypothetical protein